MQKLGTYLSVRLPKVIKPLAQSQALFLLAVVLLWQVLMTGFGVITELIFAHFNGDFTSLVPSNITLLSHTIRWDGVWYNSIINGAYSTDVSAPVFYPLFPLLVWVTKLLSFGLLGTLAASAIVTTLALWAALVALYKIANELFREQVAKYLVIAFFLAWPSAFFLHAFYSEAVFCAIAFWSYYFALKRKWLAMALLLAILTAARLPSVLFIALCGLEFLRAHGWSVKKSLNKNILYFALAPLGFIAYGTYLHYIRGDFLAMFHGYSIWSFQKFNLNIFSTFFNSVELSLDALLGRIPFTHDIFVNQLLPIVTLLILLVASLIAILRIKSWGIPLGIAGLLSFVMFTLNSNVNSVHRYTLPSITIYLVAVYMALNIKKSRLLLVFIFGGLLMVQVLLYILFITDYFAG